MIKMRKVILLMHVSLDGFVAGPKGEMNWIKVDEELFEPVGKITDEADTALYGRVTYQMMENYWPNAAEKSNATKHDIQHSMWYNNALKIVFSKTMHFPTGNNRRVISSNIMKEIHKLKMLHGKNLLLIGSPGLTQTFLRLNLIDEYYLYINPIILDKGIPLFKNVKDRINLNLLDVIRFNSGVVGLHYETKRD
jgi:dihydrofolate reductase